MKTSTIQPDWMTLPYSRQVSFNSPKGDQGNANQLQPVLMVRCPDLEFIQLFIPKCIFLFSRSNPQTPAILFWFYVSFEKENKLTCSLSLLPVFHHKDKASADLTVSLQVWKFLVTRQSFWSPNANNMFDQVMIGGVRCTGCPKKNALSESSKPTSLACRLQAASGDLSDVSACRMTILKVHFFGKPCIT